MTTPLLLPALVGALLLGACATAITTPMEDERTALAEDPRWIVYPGADEGIGAGKRVVLVAGDEEYRSEEALPMLGRLLSTHHGFECVVLFSQKPDTGEINPDQSEHIPGLHMIDEADLLVLQLRFRELPDGDMAHIMHHTLSGKPLIGIRTSTHPFNYKGESTSAYAKWTWTSKEPAGGYGKEILGETWVNHHGHHGVEATRGVPNEEVAGHAALRGVRDVFGPTDVYGIRGLQDDATVLLWGQVLAGMTPDSVAVEGAKNEPMHPVAWTRERAFREGSDDTQRIFTTTMGAATDMRSEDLRRLLLNAACWTHGLEEDIPEGGLEASMVGTYEPTDFGFGSYRKGLWPKDYRDGTPE